MNTLKPKSSLLIALLLVTGALAEPATYEAPLDLRKDGDVQFASPPKAEVAGDAVKITFAVSAATDLEVAILDAKGLTVRHLAAGVLGPNAPAPFKKDSLAQEVSWDRRDDAGNPTWRWMNTAGSSPRTSSGSRWRCSTPTATRTSASGGTTR